MTAETKILEWRKYVQSATNVCAEQFGVVLESNGIYGQDSNDLFFRVCNRYVGYLKLIHHKVKKYFVNIWGLHGIAPRFAQKDAKWFYSILERRVEDKSILTTEVIESLLVWCAFRYNFWLAQQLQNE